MAILSGREIRKEIEVGGIHVSPYDEQRVQPNSLDVTLGKGVCVYSEVVQYSDQRVDQAWPLPTSLLRSRLLECRYGELDAKKDNPICRFDMDESGWIVKPGILYLMHLEEVLYAPKHVMTLDGKSSYARLGLVVHLTAGHAETGFHGQYTLEVASLHPIRVYPGMPIAQVIFTTVEGETEDYKRKGNYVGMAAMGAQPSRSWRNFSG